MDIDRERKTKMPPSKKDIELGKKLRLELRERIQQQGVRPINALADLIPLEPIEDALFQAEIDSLKRQNVVKDPYEKGYPICVLLDTNVVSYILRGDDRAKSFEPHTSAVTPAISTQTIAELKFGALKRQWGGPKRLEELNQLVARHLILGTDLETAECGAQLAVKCLSVGKPMSQSDLWILATAERWRIPLLTCDKDFSWYEGVIDVINFGWFR